MRYVFMDNFRGFSRTVVPLDQATFLVGENSTGKSSLLSLVYLFSTPQFWFGQDFFAGEFPSLGGFNDLVSLTGNVRNRFTIGTLATRQLSGAKEGQRECAFGLYTFRNEEGMPRISRYVQYMDGKLLKIAFFPKTTRYKAVKVKQEAASDDDFVRFLLEVFNEDLGDRRGFRKLPEDVPPRSPLGVVLAVVHSIDEPRKKGELLIQSNISTIPEITWFAPIRTKPRRTYEGFKTDFTPEGDHTPYVIRKTLGTREKTQKFTQLLRRFGQSSGLFTRVDAHSFGRDPAAPFEVRIEITGGPLNICNVGYGVSQVLPVVVEMLTRPNGHWFAIQQPEVHLHPRAQAALGALMHFLVKERHHHYVVETHSEYLIDRFRLCMKESRGPRGCHVVFFERTKSGNATHLLPLDAQGKYPKDQPAGFKRFFIDEEMRLLEL